MSELRYDDLRWLHLLWVALGVALVGLYGIWQRQRSLRRFAGAALVPHLVPDTNWSWRSWRLLLIVASLAVLTLALIGPRWGAELRPALRRNMDVMVLLDVSRSMLARDIAPNRLERAKLALRDDLLPTLGGDRIGLITFAGDATLACPLTVDYGSFRLALDDVSVRSAVRGGTLIGDAIRQAGRMLVDPLDSHKLIILITDGEDHESFPVEAAAGVWQDDRIPVVALALGDARRGARIPVQNDAGERYLQHGGHDVWSKADFAALERIARVSDGGLFVPVGTSDFDLGRVYRGIVRTIRFEEDAEQQLVRQPSRYHPFAIAALLLVWLDSCLRDGPRRSRSALSAATIRREEAA